MSKLGGFFTRIFHNDVAFDLGTMNTLIRVRGNDRTISQPTVIAVNTNDEVIAVGEEAKKMLGTNPGNIRSIRPMKNGAINDPFVTDKMLERFLKQVSSPFGMMRPRVAVAVPSGISRVLRKAVEESFNRAGARVVRLVEEPFAAAVGTGLPVYSSTGCMIIDVGGGTSEIAIIANGGIVTCNSINVAGDAMDDAIIAFLEEQHNLLIGPLEAEKIKIQIGSAIPYSAFDEQEKTIEVSGQLMGPRGEKRPGSVSVTSEEIRQALDGPINRIIDGVMQTLSSTLPQLATNLVPLGMTVTGGSSKLRGFADRLSSACNMPVHQVDSPMTSVIDGLITIMEHHSLFDKPQVDPVGVNVK